MLGKPQVKVSCPDGLQLMETGAGIVAGVAANDIDRRERQLFRSLDFDNDGRVLFADLIQALRQAGLRADDVRLAESLELLDDYRKTTETFDDESCQGICEDVFCAAIRPNMLLVEPGFTRASGNTRFRALQRGDSTNLSSNSGKPHRQARGLHSSARSARAGSGSIRCGAVHRGRAALCGG